MKALIKSFKKRYQSAKKLMNKCLQPNYLTRGKQTTKPMGFFFQSRIKACSFMNEEDLKNIR